MVVVVVVVMVVQDVAVDVVVDDEEVAAVMDRGEDRIQRSQQRPVISQRPPRQRRRFESRRCDDTGKAS